MTPVILWTFQQRACATESDYPEDRRSAWSSLFLETVPCGHQQLAVRYLAQKIHASFTIQHVQ